MLLSCTQGCRPRTACFVVHLRHRDIPVLDEIYGELISIQYRGIHNVHLLSSIHSGIVAYLCRFNRDFLSSCDGSKIFSSKKMRFEKLKLKSTVVIDTHVFSWLVLEVFFPCALTKIS